MCDMNDVKGEYYFILKCLFIQSYDCYILRNIAGPNPLCLNSSSCYQCKIERNCVISVNIFKMPCIYVLNICNCPSSISVPLDTSSCFKMYVWQ